MKPTQEQLNDPKWWSRNTESTDNYVLWDKQKLSLISLENYISDIDGYELLAKRPTKPAFVPEVGEWYEHTTLHDRYGNLYYIGLDSNGFKTFNNDNGELYKFGNYSEFRPIKSERELFVETVSKVLQIDDQEVTGLCNKSIEMFHSAANALYDSGLFCLKETNK